jgi:truncated hemoglobin YjbI
MPRRAFVLLSVTLLAGCMEQDKPKKLMRDASPYTRLGGEEKVTEIVERFAAKAARSKELPGAVKEALAGPDAEAVKRRLVEQLGAALGAPYEARPGPFLTALHGHVDSLDAETRKRLKGLLDEAVRETVKGERLLGDVNKALAKAIDPAA